VLPQRLPRQHSAAPYALAVIMVMMVMGTIVMFV